MSVAAERPPVKVRERLYTAADLAELPPELATGPVRYELDNGRLITMPLPGDEHGAVESNFAADLKFQGERRGLGKVRSGEVGILLWSNPDRVVGADAVFIANASLPIRFTPQGWMATIPDLVVEVVSKNDTRPYVQRKVEDYLTAGVKVVWVADPKRRTVTINRPGRAPEVLRDGDTLTAEDVIPGFALAVTAALEE